MNYNLDTVPEHEIAKQFFDAMYRAGIEPRGELSLILDGKIHRFETKDGKRGNKNGAYKIYGDGCPNGFFQDWRLYSEPIKWTFDFETLKNNYPDIYKYSQTAEFKAEAERKHKEREAQEAAERAKAVAKAKAEFEAAKPATAEHEYLKLKKIKTAHGLKVQGDTLLVPFYNINGDFQALQRIFKDEAGKFQKQFRARTSPTGAFFVLGGHTIKNDDSVILAEGYATAATIYELLGNRYRVVMAVDSGNLTHVSKALKDKYNIRLFIAADDDAETARKNFEKYNKAINPGLDNAKKCVEAGTADGYFAPPFGEVEKFDMKLTDWNDYFQAYERDKTTEALRQALQNPIENKKANDNSLSEILTPQDIEKYIIRLNRNIEIKDVELIGGIFPRSKVSMAVSAAGVGKSWLILRLACMLSIGGNILYGGKAERPYKTLTFCGEGGKDEPITRFKETEWQNNEDDTLLLDQEEIERDGKNLILTQDTGRRNFEAFIKYLKPDIVFVDSLLAFSDKDENKGAEMHGLLRYLLKTAKEHDIALVISHHTRKRKINERKAEQDMDEIIGTSYFARYIRQIIGLQPLRQIADNVAPDDEPVLVKNLKSYMRKFKPFTFQLIKNEHGKTDMIFDFEPNLQQENITDRIFDFILENFDKGVEFTRKDLENAKLSSTATIKRALSDLVNKNLLMRSGNSVSVKYSLP